MKLPSDDHVADLFDRLRRHARPLKPGDGDRLVTLHELQPRMMHALKRARTPSPAVDGYPANLGGDGRGGAELTAVEAAAEVLVFGRGEERDVILDLTEDAYGYLEQAAQSIGALASVLDRIDRLSSTLSRSEAGGAGECLACGTLVTGGAEDRLKRGLGPCCYSTWSRHGCPDMAEFRRTRRQAS